MKYDWSNIYVFKWAELNFIKLETEIAFEVFRALNTNQEELLNLTKNKFEENIKNEDTLNSLRDEHKASFHSHMFEKEEITIKELQRIQRYAICVSIFSFCEACLKNISNTTENEFKIKINKGDFKKSGYLKGYWNYLEKVFKNYLENVEPFFNLIEQQKIVRNKIAHNDGFISEEERKKMEIVSGIKVVQMADEYQIEINDTSYISYLLDNTEIFLKELLLAIDKRYKEN